MKTDTPSTIPLAPCQLLPRPVLDAWAFICRMPFENLTKIIKFHDAGGNAQAAMRMPDEVLADHARYGTGATCFAMVFLFHELLHRAGHTPALATCDRRYGPNTHAAALLDWQGARWIFDPGFHVFQPLPRPQDAPDARYRTPDNPNASRIVRTGPARFDCFTGHAGNWQYRFTLKDENLTPDEYKRRWLGSFQSEMMGYPVLTRFTDNRMVYLQKSNLVFRDLTAGHVEKLHVGDLKDTITAHYGISPAIATRALDILKHA